MVEEMGKEAYEEAMSLLDVDVLRAHRTYEFRESFIYKDDLTPGVAQSGFFLEYVPACCTGVAQTA